MLETQNKLSFTDNELKSITVNAVGRSSEAGTKAIMRIGLASEEQYLANGTIKYPDKYINGKPNPESFNSGFSVGLLQWDIGQQRNGKEIIEIYNNSNYIKENPTLAISEKDIEKFAKVLEQNRDRDLNGENTNLTRIDIRRGNDYYRENLTRKLNNFFLTNEGFKYVLSLQERHYDERLKDTLDAIIPKSPSIQNMSREYAIEMIAAITKVTNQQGNIKSIEPFLIDKNIHTKQEIVNKIKDTYSNSVDKGVDNAIEGAKLYNTLSN
ncbi:MAG: hypothetical protein LBJ88_05425 [Campylobacteraceae bacterium]|jgi:hypothetical protein|nr:hypothetical protein [Campylobacteraceae bacterium]